MAKYDEGSIRGIASDIDEITPEEAARRIPAIKGWIKGLQLVLECFEAKASGGPLPPIEEQVRG